MSFNVEEEIENLLKDYEGKTSADVREELEKLFNKINDLSHIEAILSAKEIQEKRSGKDEEYIQILDKISPKMIENAKEISLRIKEMESLSEQYSIPFCLTYYPVLNHIYAPLNKRYANIDKDLFYSLFEFEVPNHQKWKY